MTEKVDFQKHSDEVLCALLSNGNAWTAHHSRAVGVKEHLPSSHRETRNARHGTRETLTVLSLQL